MSSQSRSIDDVSETGDDIVVSEFTIPANDRASIPAFSARPVGPGPFPTIVTLAEIHGMHYHQVEACRKLAGEGYYAVTTEPFFRQGDVAAVDRDTKIKIMLSKPDDEVSADLDAVLRWVKSQQFSDARIGLLGFCWGGRQVFLQAARSLPIVAAVSWYGTPLVGGIDNQRPKSPLDVIANIKIPILAICGGKDEMMPKSDIDAVRAAASAANKDITFIVYPDAGHGFGAKNGRTHRPEETADGWRQTLTWLRSHNVG